MLNEEYVSGLTVLPFKTTTFNEATSLKLVEGTKSTFGGFIPKDWCTTNSTHAHGGFLTSLIQATTREYFGVRYPDLGQRDAINVHAQFLNPVPSGPVFCVVKDVKIGRKLSTVQVDVQVKGKDEKLVTCTAAVVTQGNLAKEIGVSGTVPSVVKAGMPGREHCERWGEAWWMNLIPVTRKLRQYVPVGQPDLHWRDRFGPGVREAWVKIDDGSGFETLYLGKLCDAFLNVPTPLPPGKNEGLKEILKFLYPTVSMTLDIKKDPTGAEWLFLRVQATGVENGRYHIDISVMNEAGELVAVCRTMCLLIQVPKGMKVVGNTLKL